MSPPVEPSAEPAETPAQVTILSSADTIRSSSTGTAPKVRNSCTAAQCDVARLPSSRPAAARITDPEHTEAVHVDL